MPLPSLAFHRFHHARKGISKRHYLCTYRINYKRATVSHLWETLVSTSGNDNFRKWERQFPQVGTAVSASGNDSFRKWEREQLQVEHAEPSFPDLARCFFP